MSRTKKGSKAIGYDYWSRRPGSGSGFGVDAKKKTHKKERAQKNQIIARIKKGKK